VVGVAVAAPECLGNPGGAAAPEGGPARDGAHRPCVCRADPDSHVRSGRVSVPDIDVHAELLLSLELSSSDFPSFDFPSIDLPSFGSGTATSNGQDRTSRDRPRRMTWIVALPACWAHEAIPRLQFSIGAPNSPIRSPAVGVRVDVVRSVT
jgi:hypothetical protein